MLEVILATQRSVYVLGVYQAFRELGYNVDVIVADAGILTNQQSLNGQTLSNCCRRLSAARKLIVDYQIEYDFILALESGFFCDAEVGSHYKTACLTQDRLGAKQLSWSATMPISQEFYNWVMSGKSLQQLLGCHSKVLERQIEAEFFNHDNNGFKIEHLKHIDLGVVDLLSDNAINQVTVISQAIKMSMMSFLKGDKYAAIDRKIYQS